MAKTNSPIKPFLKWAGGKRQLLIEIKKHIPENINDFTYYEPFAGAGAVLFDLQPKKAVINDTNTQLAITYNAIKNNIEDLIALLKSHEKMHDKEYYYKIRNMDRDNMQFDVLTPIEKAARTIYLNKTCYNGLYRVNLKGYFNVPFGKYKNPVICNDILLRQISEYLNTNDIKILNKDFECSITSATEKSFIYFDPPYHSPGKINFTNYQAQGFGEQEQERLRNVIMEMTNRRAKCLLSNSDTEFIRKLYNSNRFKIISVRAKRTINSDSSGRGRVNEVLIKNW